jgi:hypothetical protein
MLYETPMTLSLQLYSLIPNRQINGLLRFMWMFWAAINLQACEKSPAKLHKPTLGYGAFNYI